MRKRRRVLAIVASVVVGPSLVNAVVPARRVVAGTCPTIVTVDAETEHLAASVSAGALYAWAEREDVAPLPGVRPSDDAYHLRLTNDGEDTTDHVASVKLLVVDHDETSEVLATPNGGLVLVRDAVAPQRQAPSVDLTRRVAISRLELERTGAFAKINRVLLVVEGHSTPFAERAFLHYLATMGRGVSTIMDHAVRTDCGTSCSREVMEDELERLGLPLHVIVEGGTTTSIPPTSPALPRRFAVPIDLPSSAGHVTIRLESAPGFWEADAFRIAPVSDEVTPVVLEARSATLESSAAPPEDVRARLRDADHERVRVDPRARVDLRFAAPAMPAAGRRSVFVAVRAHYRVPIGGALLHPLSILAHRWGLTSLPRFAADLPAP